MRFLLDTVTISEFRQKDRVHPRVRKWQESIGDVWLSVVTLNELRYGMRKVESHDPVFASRLAVWYSQIITQPQRFRILPVDRAVAELAADFRAEHKTPFEDSLLAASAKIHGLTLATRNTGDFAATGIAMVNPWEYGA